MTDLNPLLDFVSSVSILTSIPLVVEKSDSLRKHSLVIACISFSPSCCSLGRLELDRDCTQDCLNVLSVQDSASSPGVIMQRRKNIIAESSAYGRKWQHLCMICNEQCLAFLQLLDTRPALPSAGRVEVEVMSRLIGEKRRKRRLNSTTSA